MLQQLTTTRGSSKLPLHFEGSITFSDFVNPNKFIATISKNFVVIEVAVIVTSAFDGFSDITIGDDSAQGSLFTTGNATLGTADTYENDPNHKYTVQTDLKVYFTGTPTTGAATIYIYYQ